jgi:hypothetical protein
MIVNGLLEGIQVTANGVLWGIIAKGILGGMIGNGGIKRHGLIGYQKA